MSSHRSKISSFGKKISDYLSYDQILQERGYKPVIIFTSVDDYDSKTERIIVDTIPADVRSRVLGNIFKNASIKDPARTAIKSVVADRVKSVASEINSTLTDVTGQVSDKNRAFEGCMIDLTIPQGQGGPQNYSWANIIFQNPLSVSPAGDQFFGTDFLKYGYPIWIQIGYVDSLGQIVSHPFDTDVKTEPTVVFAGLIGSLTQEMTLQSGDRMLIQGVDFRWYFENFLLGQSGTVDKMAFLSDTTLEDAIDNFFENFLDDGGETAPDSILIAMGFEIDSINGTFTIPDVIFDDRVSKTKTPKRSEGTLGDAMEDNYLTILRRLEELYDVDINWRSDGVFNTNIVVSPRLDPYSMAFVGEKFNPNFDLWVHQAILGGNVRNWSFSIDAAGSVNRLLVKVVSPNSPDHSDTFLLDKSTIDEILDEWSQRKDVTSSTEKPGPEDPKVLITEGALRGNPLFGVKYPEVDDLDKVFGKQTKVLELVISRDMIEDTGKGIKLPSGKVLPLSKEAVSTIVRRLHYWGAKGSVMLMGNADIREGDLIEVFDKRPKGTTLLGFQPDVTKQSMTSFIERYKKKLDALGVDISTYERKQYLGMGLWENVFYVWKVAHYLGPQGYWTKVHFIKQRDSLGISRSSIFKTMRERAKKKKEED